MPPSIAREPTPDWLNKKNHPAAFPQAGDAGRVTGSKPLMPTLQPSIGTAMAQKMSNVHVAAPAAAPAPSASATAAPACGNAAGMEKSGPSASTIGEETDEESEHELTPEEQKNDEHVKNVEAVIAAAEAAGFTFGKTKWVAAETFVNNKEIFDDAGVDVTECVFEGRKEISLNQVKSKLAELRAAATEAGTIAVHGGGGMSQAFDNDSEDEKSQSEDEMSEDGYEGMSKAQLESRKAYLTTEIAVAEAKLKKNPVKIAYREQKKKVLDSEVEKGEEFEEYKQKYETMKHFYNENFLGPKKWDDFNVFQMEYFQAMLAAEIEKRELPVFIKDASKDLKNVNIAIEQINFEEFQRKNAKKEAKLAKAAQQEVAKRVGSGKRGASSSGGPSSSLRKHQRRR
jgi:uncharacterized small protein (DUF1192 family)